MPAKSKPGKKAAPKPKARKAGRPASKRKPGHKAAAGKSPRPASKVAPKAASTAPAPAKQEVTITAAKGRPMLSWVGKRPLRHVNAFPAQHVETFAPEIAHSTISPPHSTAPGGLLYHGDNKEVLAHLLANGFRGKVNLIYIDPPYDSGADYVRKVSLRGPKGSTKLDGESYALGEQIQYTDIWANDNYLQFMFERLMMLKELLSESGSIYLHCDWHKDHVLRLLLDEVFGPDNFVNEIIWWYYDKMPTGGNALDRQHDVILQYRKGGTLIANPVLELRENPNRKREIRQKIDGKMIRVRDDSGKQIFAEDNPYKRSADVWRMSLENSMAAERSGFPTQKPLGLLERVVSAGSNPGDLVLDIFLGSGTTAAAAQRLGRRWIGCDINKGAIQTAAKRLQSIITEQIAAAKKAGAQPELIADDKQKAQPPAQLAFTVHRVNDYDLAIQHNEAVNLACEHIGITRTKADSFFAGTIGPRLAKIIPFGHPLSPPDLEDLKRELEARPNEERDVVVVCLGKELTVDAWLADWNRLRQRGDVPNKIEVIELRTDPKFGKFIAHTPARAKVAIKRAGDMITVTILDFISPTILERLQSQAGLLQPKVDDWRAMVDSVMIDAAHDGKVFTIALADVPEKKTDFVSGKYELPAPKGPTTVAVKITDMLGEEVVVTATV